MSAFALSLLLAAGAMHAAWNLLLKQSENRLVVTWLALTAGSLLFLLVIYFIRRDGLHHPILAAFRVEDEAAH